ncbi:MAG: response regulator transcription factor [Firmicutes bacterium]|nr:response regulator transcription factor [Bacillota bacterium]
MFKILIAEDEPHLRAAIAKSLKAEGYSAIEAYDGKNALGIFNGEHVDLIVTDIMMPRMSGNDFAREVRKVNKDVPILMLTALETIDDKERGFNSGTDDYLVKPIHMKELVLRVKALLRRYKINSENKIELPHTLLDFNAQTLTVCQKAVELNKKEFRLLFKLLSNPNVILSREKLLNEIWGYDVESTDRTVDTHIRWLREKAESPDFEIHTVWGLGYKALLK